MLVNCRKFTIQRFQLCVKLNTLYLYFLWCFQISSCESDDYSLLGNIQHIWFWHISQTLFYIKTKIIIFFAMGTLIYSVAMIPGWLFISLECTEICALERNFLPRFLLLNSTLCHWTKNSPKYYHTFRIINIGSGSMCFWNIVYLSSCYFSCR